MVASGNNSSQKDRSSSKPTVVLQPLVFCTIALHAHRHPDESTHGFLVGRHEDVASGTIVQVDQAVPVSHGAPTRPLVEMSMGLVEASLGSTTSQSGRIVGWYTAPRLCDDTQPGPVALRMVASLATSVATTLDSKRLTETATNPDPVLLVLQNKALGQLLRQKQTSTEASDVFHAYGRDFGQQWLEPLTVKVSDSQAAGRGLREGVQQCIVVNDFMDHLEGPPSTSWFPPPEELIRIVK